MDRSRGHGVNVLHVTPLQVGSYLWNFGMTMERMYVTKIIPVRFTFLRTLFLI
jgi:hypothetical protein